MARKKAKNEVIRNLLARSGNRCAYPNCTHPILNDKNKLIAQLCHIEAAEVGGERYNPEQSDEDRRSYDNLLFLCYRHHVETNDTSIFDVNKMQLMKQKHENQYREHTFVIEEESLREVEYDISKYWSSISLIHKYENVMPEDLRYEYDFNKSIIDLIHEHFELLDNGKALFEKFNQSDENLMPDLIQFFKDNGIDTSLLDGIPYTSNPFENRNWEISNLGAANLVEMLDVSLKQIEIKALELILLSDSDNSRIKRLLDEKRKAFVDVVRQSGYHD